MFTVVGLLGMTGIIINDSIVLVTTIDSYAEDRGLIPSIVDATADRLRPVLLTTLTTVLGLAPLMYEQSQQAQFLKPTVITLVYGLGFGMGLVLLVVPALVAVQRDMARPFIALRRALGGQRGPRWPVVAALVLTLTWLAGTFGWVMVRGGLHPWIAGALPMPADLSAQQTGMISFVAGAMAILLLVWLVTALVMLVQRRAVRS
jgi:cytochrome bd-type quinol oxidase subunit 1